MAKTDTSIYKRELRRFLHAKGREADSAGKYQCVRPQNHANGDAHFSCVIYDDERFYCAVCGSTMDLFEISGELGGFTTFPEKLRDVQDTLGISNTWAGKPAAGNPDTRHQRTQPAPSFVVLPLDRARAEYTQTRMLEIASRIAGVVKSCGDHLRIAGVWPCIDPDGNVEIVSVRFEGDRVGEKAVIAFWWDGAHVGAKQPPVRLFGRQGLSADVESPVLIVEGEKCWEAAKAIPGMVPVTWNGGAKKVGKADWSPLGGREVVIYPDDDKPGRETALELVRLLGDKAKSIHIADPLPEARKIKNPADIVEALQVRSPQEMAEYLLSGPTLQDGPDVGATVSGSSPGRNGGAGDSKPPEIGDLPFRILGTGDDNVGYFLDGQERLHGFPLKTLSKSCLMALAGLEWWGQSFPGHRSSIYWDGAVDFIIRECQSREFSLDSCRGRGAWNGLGSGVYFDGRILFGINDRSGIVYRRKSQMNIGLDAAPATPETRTEIMEAVCAMSFETRPDAVRLLAWSVLAPFAGALPWRPAGFLTGPSGAGKSTVLQYVVVPLAKPLIISGHDSTAAGIRQEIGNDSRPVVIDEAEADDEKATYRRNEQLALMRQSTSDDAPKIVKGTQNGSPMAFSTRSMFLFSAIDPMVASAADQNRLFTVAMAAPTNDWRPVKRRAIAALSPAVCDGVRAFTWAHLEEIIADAERIADAVQAKTGYDTRYSFLEGMLFSAFWRVFMDRPPSDKEN